VKLLRSLAGAAGLDLRWQAKDAEFTGGLSADMSLLEAMLVLSKSVNAIPVYKFDFILIRGLR
jgi:hypothetical protein